MKIPFHHNIIRSSFLILFLGIQTFKLIAQDTSETLPQVGTTQKIGDVILFVLPVATAGTSLIKGDNQGVWQFTKGFVMTEALTYGLKLSINNKNYFYTLIITTK